MTDRNQPEPARGQPRRPVNVPSSTTVQEIDVPIEFDPIFTETASLLEPIGRDEFARIIESRLDQPKNQGLFAKVVYPGPPGAKSTDVSAVANKIAELVPESLLRRESADEIWLLPLVAVLARGNGTNMRVNSVDVSADVTSQASEIFEQLREGQLTAMEDEAFAAQLDQTADPNADPAVIAAQVYASLLMDEDVFVPMSPTTSDEESAVVAVSRSVTQFDDEGNPIAPVEASDAVSANSFEEILKNIGTIGNEAAAARQPVLRTEDVQQLFRTSAMDFDALLAASATPPDEVDPATGQMRAGAAAANVNVQVTAPTQAPTGTGPGLQQFSRQYSPLSALQVLWSMSPAEITNIQDKLTRAGYISDEQGVRRGDPGDGATFTAWRQLLSDSIRAGRPAMSILTDRVRTTISKETAQSFGDEWGQKNLGRNLTRGEAYTFSRYMNDPARSAPEGNLGLGDQVMSYFDRTFESERTAKVARGHGQSLRGWTQAWARDHDMDIAEVAEMQQ